MDFPIVHILLVRDGKRDLRDVKGPVASTRIRRKTTLKNRKVSPTGEEGPAKHTEWQETLIDTTRRPPKVIFAALVDETGFVSHHPN